MVGPTGSSGSARVWGSWVLGQPRSRPWAVPLPSGPQFSRRYSEESTQITLKALASSEGLVLCGGSWGRSRSLPLGPLVLTPQDSEHPFPSAPPARPCPCPALSLSALTSFSAALTSFSAAAPLFICPALPWKWFLFPTAFPGSLPSCLLCAPPGSPSRPEPPPAHLPPSIRPTSSSLAQPTPG